MDRGDASDATHRRLCAVAVANTAQFVIGYPLDTMKTWYQTGTRFSFAPRKLYAGILPTLILGSGVSGLCFESFERGTRILPDYIAAMGTGVCAAAFTAIADPMKIHRQVGCDGGVWGGGGGSVGGIRALHTILPRYGRFFIHCLSREVPFCGIYFTTQHRLRRNGEMGAGTVGAVSSVGAWLATYPMDVMKTHNIARTITAFGGGAVDVPVFQWTGVRYDRGLPVSVARVGLCGGIFMYVYDMLGGKTFNEN
jgi:hypothetical protein